MEVLKFRIKLFERIKRYLLNRAIRSIKKQPSIPVSFENANTYGVLFTIKNKEEYKALMKLRDEIVDQKKSLYMLGFCTNEDRPSTIYIDYLRKEDFNWYKKPTGDKIKMFLDKKYDLLLNLDFTNSDALNYIAAKSTGFKACALRDNKLGIYDFMIKCSDESIKRLLKNLKLYLN